MQPEYFTLKNFKFESQFVLPKLKIEYSSFGTKELDENGNLINGIIYLHGSSGDYSSVKRIKDITGPGKPIDTENYYIICPTALGSPGSSCPSNSGLGHYFPKYTIKDMVNAINSFLKECFNVKHLKGVIGTSMGGFQALEWAVSYPDFMDFVILITTSHDVKGKNYAISNLMNAFIMDDPAYKSGEYETNPQLGCENANMFLYLFGFSDEYYKNCSNEEILESIEVMKEEGSKTDANDIIWHNEATISYNVTSRLSNIRAKTLIIGVNQDLYFPPQTDTIPMSKLIDNATLFLYDSILGHLGSSEIKKAEDVIWKFLNE
ncbi:MAG TPA: alpha/beta fold hydrolase [Methanobacterium sp.]|nr:alpha/beta fold hydrolase [Methanobacterium sp.]